jgi:xanthine dehydrogenase molybdopterin-binding subunit B
VKPYNIFGATVCEVEVDLLTGQHQVSSTSKFTEVLEYFTFNVSLFNDGINE